MLMLLQTGISTTYYTYLLKISQVAPKNLFRPNMFAIPPVRESPSLKIFSKAKGLCFNEISESNDRTE